MEDAERTSSPSALRLRCRQGLHRRQTSGFCPGFAQANLVVLPASDADDFELFCRRNSKPCPLLEVLRDGPLTSLTAAAADVRSDLPRYRVWRHGVHTETVDDITHLWEWKGRGGGGGIGANGGGGNGSGSGGSGSCDGEDGGSGVDGAVINDDCSAVIGGDRPGVIGDGNSSSASGGVGRRTRGNGNNRDGEDGENGGSSSNDSGGMVAFLLGCSFSFEEALEAAGLQVRHVELGCNVPMYRTAVDCVPAGKFRGKLVVSMRPYLAAAVPAVTAVTARYPRVHGAPVHAGDATALGIADLSRPDYGDPVPIREGEIPVFWACGVTPQAALAAARPALCVSHEPGHMLVLDVRNEALAGEGDGDESDSEPAAAADHGLR